MLPGGLDLELAARQEQVVALIDLDLLRSAWSDETMEQVTSAAQCHVLSATRASTTRLGKMLNRWLELVLSNPEVLRHPAAVHALEQALLETITRTRLPPVRRRGRGRPNQRRPCMARVLEFLRSADLALVTTADLCAVAGVGERTLESAFRDTIGISPHGALQMLRLHAARAALLVADTDAATVSQIAYSNGFFQLGRFATRYRQLFGESPSDTLGRPYPDAPRDLLRMPR